MERRERGREGGGGERERESTSRWGEGQSKTEYCPSHEYCVITDSVSVQIRCSNRKYLLLCKKYMYMCVMYIYSESLIHCSVQQLSYESYLLW